MLDIADVGQTCLRVAAQAKVGITGNQHLVIYGSVNFVAGGATFAQGFMFPNKGASLFLVTFKAGFIDVFH